MHMVVFDLIYFSILLRLCDEATSALDSTTEAEILNALKSLANNRTSVFIAHRLTTAMQCDEVKNSFLDGYNYFWSITRHKCCRPSRKAPY